MDYKYGISPFHFYENPQIVKFNSNNLIFANREEAERIYERALNEVVQLHYIGQNKPWNSPFVLKYKEWLKSCRDAGLLLYYLRMQPLFLMQRLKRYSLKRFLCKLKKKYMDNLFYKIPIVRSALRNWDFLSLKGTGVSRISIILLWL